MVKEGAEDLSCLLNCLSVSLLGFSSFINNKKLLRFEPLRHTNAILA